MRVSDPSVGRRVTSGVILVTSLALGLLVKLARDRGILPFLLPLDVGGTSPSFVIPFAVPFWLLAGNRPIRWIDTIKAAGATALGAVGYELIQPWMTGRTFDRNDIVAALLGAAVSILVAWVLFYRRRA